MNSNVGASRAFKTLVSESDGFRANPRFLDYVRENGHKSVQGWITDGALTAISCLAALQEKLAVSGAVCEIGIHHGRLFIALISMVPTDTLCLAVDVFENQDANIDQSGKGDYAQFKANMDRWVDGQDRVRVVMADSLTLSPSDLLDQVGGGPVRLFSVDGGHTVRHVINDMVLAEAMLAPGGVVIVDDFGNPHWPGVIEGVFRYMIEDRAEGLVPVAYGDNKLYMVRKPDRELYHAFIEQGLRPSAVDYKAVEICGYPVHQIRIPPPARLFGVATATEPLQSIDERLSKVSVAEFTGSWHPMERIGRWTGAARSGIIIGPDKGQRRQKIAGRFAAVVSPEHPKTDICILVNGVEVARGTYEVGGAPLQLAAKIALRAYPNSNSIEFVTDYAVSPRDIKLSSDGRTLGVFVIDLQLL